MWKCSPFSIGPDQRHVVLPADECPELAEAGLDDVEIAAVTEAVVGPLGVGRHQLPPTEDQVTVGVHDELAVVDRTPATPIVEFVTAHHHVGVGIRGSLADSLHILARNPDRIRLKVCVVLDPLLGVRFEAARIVGRIARNVAFRAAAAPPLPGRELPTPGQRSAPFKQHPRAGRPRGRQATHQWASHWHTMLS